MAKGFKKARSVSKRKPRDPEERREKRPSRDDRGGQEMNPNMAGMYGAGSQEPPAALSAALGPIKKPGM
jgi:hypothetical protein